MSLTIDGSFYQTATALLHKLGTTPTVVNLNLLAAWSYCEKPHYAGSSWQWNNPLNTTQPGFGATTSVNSAGVKQYPTQADGIAATVATLTNGKYPQLVTALKSSDAALFFSQTGEMATWGTKLNCIHTIYGALATPPTQYLTTSSSGSGSSKPPTSVLLSQTTASTHGWILLGTLVAAGGVAIGTAETLTHWSTIREWFARQQRHGTLKTR